MPAPKKIVQFQDQLQPDQTKIDKVFKDKLFPPQIDPRVRVLQQQYRDPNSSSESFQSADSTPTGSGTVTPVHVQRELTEKEFKEYAKAEKTRLKEAKRFCDEQIQQEIQDIDDYHKRLKKEEALQKKLAKQGINEITTGLENFEVENPLLQPSKFTRSATAAFRQSFKAVKAWPPIKRNPEDPANGGSSTSN